MATGNSKFKILAVGSPVLDISQKVPLSFLEKHNIKKAQALITKDPSHPFIEELLANPESKVTCGGSILNTLRVLSWGLKEHHDSYELTMASGFAKDDLGLKILEYMEKEKVGNLFEYYDNGLKTAKCGCAIYEKDRSMIFCISDVQLYSDQFFELNFHRFIEYDMILIEGYYVGADFPKIKKIVDSFKSNNKQVACSLSSPFILQTFPKEMKYLVENSDIIFGNLEEAEAFIQYQTCDKEGEVIYSICSKFGNEFSNKKLAVITNDHKAIGMMDYDWKEKKVIYENVFEIPQKITFEEIEDKNGAGDSFMGGYLAAKLLGKDYKECIEAGNRAAVNILKKVGCDVDWNKSLF